MAAMRAVLLLGLLAVASAKGPFIGTDKNFDSAVLGSGKNVFVKFLARHCKSMKPDWDKLGKQYSDSDSVLIVDVDCTAEGQGVCGKVGVKGYPTIKYYVAGDKKGKDYQGGRDLNSLQSFVESKLNKPVCNAETKKGCKEAEVTYIEKHEGKSAAEIATEMAAKAAELKQAKADFKDLQKEFKDKEKAFKKEESRISKATAILKQLEKLAKKRDKAEL